MKNYAIIQQFRSAIRRGTGEAHLLMEQYPSIDFSREIIKASLFNYAYDGQSERSRASYLFELIELSQNKDRIWKAILGGLATEDDTWSLTQLFALALEYAKRGERVASDAIYNRFHSNIIQYSSWAGGTEIIELDGLGGMLLIADKVGEYLKSHEDENEDEFLIRFTQENCPEIDVNEVLEREAQQNENIRFYIDNVKEAKAYWGKARIEQNSYSNIIEEIEQRQFISLKNRVLTPKEMQQIADRFLAEKNREIRSKFLRVFRHIKYPYSFEPLLTLAKKRADKYRLQEYATEALKHIQSEEVREFALNKIETSRCPALYSDILINNYNEGDEKLLTQIANKFKNADIVESLASSYIKIYTNNKTQACQQPLEVLYNKSNCGICRNRIVTILIQNNVLSGRINREIKFDCNEDTRALSISI